MWNLNGDDIKKAKDELESRRATLKAEYEEKVQRIDAELADIDAVERVAVNFVSTRKGDNPASGSEAAPEKAAEKEPSSENGVTEIKVAEKPAENSSEKENKPAGETAPMEQKGSRWRMRLGTLSETEAAD
jgi:hypothetical protein